MGLSPAAGASSGPAAPAIYGFPSPEASPAAGGPCDNGPAVMRGVEQIPWLYDAVCAACEAFGLARWRRWLVAGARGRVLDVGCGTGRNLPLLPPGAVAVGLDPSWHSLRRARRRGTTIGIDALADDLALSAPPEDRNQIRDFVRAMASLSEDHRQILLLVSLEGLTYREIAELLEVPIGTVMSRLARARERLRTALEGGNAQILRRVP